MHGLGGLAIYVALTRMRVSNTSTYLRVRFVNSQNLDYEHTDDKYPKFGYECKMCLTKINNF